MVRFKIWIIIILSNTLEQIIRNLKILKKYISNNKSNKNKTVLCRGEKKAYSTLKISSL